MLIALLDRLNDGQVCWKHFLIALFFLAWPLAGSLFFLYDRELYMYISFFKLNLILSALVMPDLLTNAYFIYFILLIVFREKPARFSVLLLPSFFLGLLVVVFLLVAANVLLLTGVSVYHLLLYGGVFQCILSFIFLLLMYLEYSRQKVNDSLE